MDELGQNSKDHELVRREAGLNAQRATLARTTLVKEINTLSAENKELRDRMALLEQELKTCKASYEECDAERNILLTARGIIPKVNPVWAPMRSYSPVKVAVGAKDKISNEYEQKSSMKDIADNPARGMYMELNTWTYTYILTLKGVILGTIPSSLVLRIWVGTWNMGASPLPILSGNTKSTFPPDLRAFVTPGYDLYALGVQEGVG